MSILPKTFFARDSLLVAPELLGKYLLRTSPEGGEARHMITEVEAYRGEEDLACHARRGRTKRTEVMYGPPGQWYVYLVYGMHEMLNVVVGEEGYPAAILIRGVEGYEGPGKLTRALSITRDLNTLPAGKNSGLWIEEGESVAQSKIETLPRVGVDYAGEKWASKPWRFRIK